MPLKRETLTSKQYVVPFALITSLFFLWGFARNILDVLNKHFHDSLEISNTEAALVQVTTYLGYFLMAVPAGMFINRFGYKKGVVLGLLLYAAGAFMFIPGSHMGTLYPFLVCLFVIACGLAILETSANPYAAELGAKETSASRLNFAQSFNGLGACLAPITVGTFLFSEGESADVSIPYAIMGVVVVVVAIIFAFSKLPEIKHDDASATETVEQVRNPYSQLFKNKMFIFGALALLAYEVAEISVNSYFVTFASELHIFTAKSASQFLGFGLIFFMVGRFVGSWVMQGIPAEKTLYACATGTIISIVGIIISSFLFLQGITWLKYAPLVFVVSNYMCEAIMFPTIFSLAIKGLGNLTKSASSILMMTPVGGCAFVLVGLVADQFGYVAPFFITLIAFLVVWAYARKQDKEYVEA